MKQVPAKPKNKSLLQTGNSGDIRSMSGDKGFRSWAKSSGAATSKEIDGLSLPKLQGLYIEYLKSRGQ